MSHIRPYLIIPVLLGLALAGCSTLFSPSITSTPVEGMTSTPQPSITPRPTQTPVPSDTPTPRPTSTATSTPTSTPDPALAKVKFIGVSWRPHYDLMMSFQFPGPVDASQYTVMVENETYDCQVLPQYPDRLYCIGRGRNVYGLAHVQIFPKVSDQPGYVKDISIPYF